MQLLRVDSSLRTTGSVSRALADTVEQEWRLRHPAGTVTRRDLGREPLPLLWPAAVAASTTPDHGRTPEQHEAAGLTADLADELVAADALLVAVPMYNYGIPQQIKNWIDLIITDPRFAAGARPLLADRPAVLAVARGGGYAPGTPREGWDHATPYLHRILADLWRLDLRTAEAELTLADANPAMHHLRDIAHTSLTEAHRAARRHGAELARRSRVSV
ncbi:FMN-dependent NADH-azoreductase [Pseudonocardia acaciae]|uniref:FMN-dependent NADH-azoreductase n=1 Tax=Pseudonocardia acaciae TaxID=551276 RepID=UPI00048D63E4|nr:NAD(P)H-dependent oxidoreductase [Pseudonocardia acaciae]